MKKTNSLGNLTPLILSMCIFGTIGIFRRYIGLPSTFISLSRAVVGTLFLLVLIAVTGRQIDLGAIRRNLKWLILSSAAMGFNWIFLFESYNYTTVTTATLCYYMAPSIMVLASHFLFSERLTLKKGICVLVAFLGMVLVSGVLKSQLPSVDEIKGILFGLGAALLYATVILLNKKMDIPSAYDKTVFQLGIAALVLLPYTWMVGDLSALAFTPMGVILLLTVGIVHTGFAYALYFGSVTKLPTQTVALFSYIDPILAIVLSALILGEPLGVSEILGSVMILGAAYTAEK